MKKKLLLLSLMVASLGYANEEAKETEIKLEETVVTSATGFATELRSIAASISIITAEDIEEKNYRTLSDALADMASVNITKGSFGDEIDIRGQGADANRTVQLLIDGVPINPVDSHSSTMVDAVSMSDVERIEVIPGGGAVLYGSGTGGGVVNVITKKGKGSRGSFGYDFTTFGGHNREVSLGQSFGKIDVSLSYSNNDELGYREHSESLYENFQGKLRYDINENQNLELKYSKYNGRFKYPSYLTASEVEADRNQGIEDKNYTISTKEDYILTYNGKFSNGVELNTVVYDAESTFYTTMEDVKKGVEVKGKIPYGDKSSVVVGAEYQDSEAKRSATYLITKETLAAFAVNNYKYKNFDFNQGIRYEEAEYEVNNQKPTEDNFAYEISGSYLYSDTGKAFVRYEKGFLSPPPSYRVNVDYVNDTTEINDLKTETYDSFEMGMSDYIGFTTISLSAFYTNTENEVVAEFIGGGHGSSEGVHYYNLGATKRYGIDINFEQEFGKLILTQGYQYLKTEITEGTNNGNAIQDVPENKFVLNAKYNMTDKFNIIGEIIYKGSTYVTDANTGKNEGYTVANLKFNYNADNGLSLHAGINNLFDKEYFEDVNYSSSTGYTYDPAAERNYYIGFDYKF